MYDLSVSERFWPKVTGGDFRYCWTWLAARNDRGYGRFQIDGVTRYSHRVAYELMVGEIPEGMSIDHLCRNHTCVNPWHLEVVSPLENTRRGLGNVARRQCPQGHDYDEQNTRRTAGRRVCRICNKRAVLLFRIRNIGREAA